jgi:hypothetical protein
MYSTFFPYSDKRAAQRGFVREFKGTALVEHVDQRVIQKDGKWGFEKLTMKPEAPEPKVTKPRPKKGMTAAEADVKHKAALNEVLAAKPQEPQTPFAQSVARADRRDPELEAALEQHDDAGNDAPPPAPDAFSLFAFGQLGAASNKAPESAKTMPAAKVQVNRSEQNGVKHPSEGTICDQVWVIAQNLSGFVAEGKASDHSKVATLSQVVKAAEAAGINKYTARTQYARWRVFNGILGRLQTL